MTEPMRSTAVASGSAALSDIVKVEPRPARRIARSVAERDSFFLWMAGLLLSVVLAGFAPTLYARAFFDVPPMPFYLHVHGAILTAWFVWLFGQTVLARAGRIDLHRQLGIAGAMLAGMVVLAGLMAQLDKEPRIRALGQDMGARLVPDSGIFWTNIGTLALFLGFVAAAIALRRRAATHKRLMLLASVSIIGPALGRVARWPLWNTGDLTSYAVLERTFPIGGIAFFMIALVIYDLITRKRIHPATAAASVLIFVVRVVMTLIAHSPAGLEYVRGLS
jgi:hypothetical protein